MRINSIIIELNRHLCRQSINAQLPECGISLFCDCNSPVFLDIFLNGGKQKIVRNQGSRAVSSNDLING